MTRITIREFWPGSEGDEQDVLIENIYTSFVLKAPAYWTWVGPENAEIADEDGRTIVFSMRNKARMAERITVEVDGKAVVER